MAPTNAGILALGNSQEPIPMQAAPIAPAIGPAAAATAPALVGGTDQMGNPAPPMNNGMMPPSTAMNTGVSASPQHQLAAQIGAHANEAMRGSANPDAPMGWAKAWVSGVMSGLGSMSAMKPLPPHEQSKLGAALFQVGNVVNAQQEQAARQQAAKAQQAHQKFEEQRETNKDKQEAEAFNASRALQYVQTQKALRSMSTEDQDAIRKQAEPWIKAHTEAGQKLVQDGLSSEELSKLAYDHRDEKNGDPKGLNWLHNQDIQQTGWRDETDANGDIKMKYGPNGQVLGPDRRQTYGVFTWGDDVKVTPELSKQLESIDKHFAPGDILDAKVARALELQIQQKDQGELAAKKMLFESGKLDNEITSLSKEKDKTDAGKILTPWLVDSKWDPGTALQNMQQAIAEVGPDGKPTPHAQAVQQQYDQIMGAFGPELIKANIDATEKKQIEQIKANAAAAKNKPLEIEGDPNLEGEAYMASLPPGRKDIVRQIGNGQAGELALSRLTSGKDGQLLLAEVTHAYPDFDGSKISGYKGLVKEFSTGKTANQIKAINVLLPHLDDLYSAVDQLPSGALPYIGEAEAKMGNPTASMIKTAKNQAAHELASVYSTGAVTDQTQEQFEKQLDVDTPMQLKNNIKSIIHLLQGRVDGIQDQWDKTAPSSSYKPPREIVDAKAQGAKDHVAALSEGVKNPPPARAFAQVKEGQQTKFANGQIWTRQNGIPVLVTGQGAQ